VAQTERPIAVIDAMLADEMTWLEPLKPVDDEAISGLESRIGVSFPADYRAFLRKYQGGVPAQTDFPLNDPQQDTALVASFLAVAPARGSRNIVGAMELLHDQLPERMIPIGMDGGGDFVLMDFRGQRPEIVYWHHERSGRPDQFTFVASTFTEFLNLLYEPDVEEESRRD
jgi:hypothetical protein